MLRGTQLAGFMGYTEAAAGGGAPTPDILWWKFTNGSGTTVTATVGVNGTMSGGTLWSTGKSGSGYCAETDGIDDTLASSSNVTYSSNIVTVTAWVYYDTFDNWDGLIDSKLSDPYTGDTNVFFSYLVDSGDGADQLGCYLFGTTGYLSRYCSSIAMDTWTHIAIIFDNSTAAGNITVYKNGAAASMTTATSTKTGTSNITANTLQVFRNFAGGVNAKARIDDLRIYSYALTSTQVGLVYAEAE